ncbi:hypothetical protein B0J13DRAFT_646593 [Dactylonectria estremocensis]|uniref:Uncharacterized protein n=1 Tax=Dactylonectria estremocensis TaxID=1079267 RepID=A0A9P9IL97_9HYPO|nr:hypothetical protein B0J13DRAFT_646593 [Dactylonectria estremocensis]
MPHHYQPYDPPGQTCFYSLQEVLGSADSGKDNFYVLSEAPSPLPPYRPITVDGYAVITRYGERKECYWQMGRAMIKSSKIHQDFATWEHVTWSWVSELKPGLVPDIYFQHEMNGYNS